MMPPATTEQQADRQQAIERLYEDIRRALNNREFDRASRLSLQLATETATDDFLRSMTFPVCLECNGYAEVVDPKRPELKTMCSSAPKACFGNKGGRMSHEQYAAYLEAKLEPLQPTQTEAVPHPTIPGGDVPKLPPDDQRPTQLGEAERARIQASPGSGQVDVSETGRERPPIVQS
jgi:hypothetical protein